MSPVAPSIIPGEAGDLFASFVRHLRARGRSERTVESYREAVARLVAHAGPDVAAWTPDALRGWLADEQSTTAPGSVGIRYRSVRAFLNWLVAEGEIDRSPLANIGHPAQPDTPAPVLDLAQLQALIAATSGKDWRSVRDRALVLFFLDSGCRRGEVAGLTLDDLDLDRGEARVNGKTGPRTVALGATAVAGLDKWLRARRKLPQAASTDAVWLGAQRPLSDEGIRQALKRLSADAGIPTVNPHQLRHTWAHEMRKAGMGDAELMELAGWRSSAMLARYGRSAVGERAREQHRKIAPGDRL